MDRWSSFKNSEYLNCNFIYFFFQVCTVDKKLSIYFIFSFYLVPFSFYSKSVDRGTSSENSGELMVIVCVSLFKSVDKMLFVLFYFPSTLYPLKVFLHKVWTGGQAMIILKILMASICISLFKSMDMWTKSCLSISCFLSLLYSLDFLQKVWTGGQALKKINPMYFIIRK